MALNKGLGRGLDSLFDINTEESAVTEVMLSEIEPNRDQPRKDFDEQALNELAASIKKHGLIQPILVRAKQSGGYEIVAGERRWRAARIAELEEMIYEAAGEKFNINSPKQLGVILFEKMLK